MIKNYFKVALRNLWRNKAYSGINILGLALGLAVFILIMLWVQYEMSYNDFHKGRERIAAVMTNLKFESGEVQTFPAVPSVLAETIQKDLPGVEYAATTSWGDNRQFTVGDKKFVEYGLYVSPEFLKIFNFPLMEGNKENALKEPNTILITEKLAEKYFGNEDPIGKTIIIEQTTPYKVEGILKNVSDHTTLTFDFLMPVKDYINWATGGKENWEINNMRAYLKLKPGIDRKQFDKSFTNILAKYTDKQPKATNMLWYLPDWYLRFDFKDGKYAGGGRITYVKLFIVIALFILLLACINFMNLSTARATQRAKEVGSEKGHRCRQVFFNKAISWRVSFTFCIRWYYCCCIGSSSPSSIQYCFQQTYQYRLYRSEKHTGICFNNNHYRVNGGQLPRICAVIIQANQSIKECIDPNFIGLGMDQEGISGYTIHCFSGADYRYYHYFTASKLYPEP